jgi:hypothetical protein
MSQRAIARSARRLVHSFQIRPAARAEIHIFPGMDDLIAEKLRAAWTAVPADRCALLLEAAQFHIGDDESDRAVAIWKHLIAEGGTNSDLARLDYAEYLFDEFEDDAAYVELDLLLVQWRIFSKAWRRAVEMVEDREPWAALCLYTLAMDSIDPEYLRVPTLATRYLRLAAGRRRMRWQLGVRLTGVDLHASISRLESGQKESELLRLVGEPQVIGGHLRCWDREVLEALHTISRRPPASHYLAAERVLRAEKGRRPVVVRLQSADWTHLVQLARNATHLDDLHAIVGRYDQGSIVEWPPGRNQPCWCGSGVKYKKCCGASTATFAAVAW